MLLEEINHSSQESKDLILEMGNTEIFEFHETSSKRQCPDCALYWEIGIVYCSCGKCMQPTETSRQFNKDRFDMLSIPGYVIKENQFRGVRHGQSLRQTMYHKGRDMLSKAKNTKEWSLNKLFLKGGIRTQNIARICLNMDGQKNKSDNTTHSHWKTIPMKLREKNWQIVVNEEGKQGLMRQRPDFCEAKHTYRQLHKEHVESTGEGNSLIHPADQTRQSDGQQFKGFEEYNYMVHPRTVWNIIHQQVRLHPRTGSSTTIGSRIKVGIIGDLQPGLNSLKNMSKFL